MPNYNYDEIIKQSQANVEELGKKLKDLDKIYQDIDNIKINSEGIPLAFEVKFQEISGLSKQYTETLGVASKTYLDGSNSLFTNKLNEFSAKNAKLGDQISRLVNTDLTKLFNDLQKVFIGKTIEEVRIELNKIGKKTTDFQTKIESLGIEINRLKKVDLEKNFDKLQKTLSDIFGAINAINLTLIGLTSSLNSTIQSLGQIQRVIEDNSKETNKLIIAFSEETNNHLSQQDKKNNTEFEILKKEIKTNRTIQIIGLGMIVALLIYLIVK